MELELWQESCSHQGASWQCAGIHSECALSHSFGGRQALYLVSCGSPQPGTPTYLIVSLCHSTLKTAVWMYCMSVSQLTEGESISWWASGSIPGTMRCSPMQGSIIWLSWKPCRAAGIRVLGGASLPHIQVKVQWKTPTKMFHIVCGTFLKLVSHFILPLIPWMCDRVAINKLILS